MPYQHKEEPLNDLRKELAYALDEQLPVAESHCIVSWGKE